MTRSRRTPEGQRAGCAPPHLAAVTTLSVMVTLLAALSGCVASKAVAPIEWRAFDARYTVAEGEDLRVRLLPETVVADALLVPRFAYPVEVTRLREGPEAVTTFYLDGDWNVVRRDRDLTAFGFDKAPRTEASWPQGATLPPLGIGLLAHAGDRVFVTAEAGGGATVQASAESERSPPMEFVSLDGTYAYQAGEPLASWIDAWDLSWDRPLQAQRSAVSWGVPLESIPAWPASATGAGPSFGAGADPAKAADAAEPAPQDTPGTDRGAGWPSPLPLADDSETVVGTPWSFAEALDFLAAGQPEARETLATGCVRLFSVEPDAVGKARGALPAVREHFFIAELVDDHAQVVRYEYIVTEDDLLGPSFQLASRSIVGAGRSCDELRSGPGPAASVAESVGRMQAGWQHAAASRLVLRLEDSSQPVSAQYVALLAPHGAAAPYSPYRIQFHASNDRFDSVEIHPEDLALLDAGRAPGQP